MNELWASGARLTEDVPRQYLLRGGPLVPCGRSRMVRFLLRTLVVLWFLGVVAVDTRADSVGLGVVSFDPFIPGAIDAFTINNSTGAFSVAGFPVISGITFTGATLAFTGSSLAGPALGDLGPGGSQFQVLDSESFSTATFQAQLSATLFTLADGSHFQANSNTVTATILPATGSTLTPGVDFALITISGTVVAAQVAEPPSWCLLVAVAPWFILLGRVIRRPT